MSKDLSTVVKIHNIYVVDLFTLIGSYWSCDSIVVNKKGLHTHFFGHYYLLTTLIRSPMWK